MSAEARAFSNPTGFLGESRDWPLCEPGTNVAAGTVFVAEFGSRVLPWYNPADAKGHRNWKQEWQTLRSRFEKLIDQYCPQECILEQRRIPDYAANSSSPMMTTDYSRLIWSGGGLSREPAKLSAPDFRPLTGIFPIRSVRGDPMLFDKDKPLAFRMGLRRYFLVQGGIGAEGDSRPRPIPQLVELMRDGTSSLYLLPAEVAVPLWQNWPSGFSKKTNSDVSLWLDALFELSWQQECEGTALYSERAAWAGNSSVYLRGLGLFPQLPYDLFSRADALLLHDNGHPTAYRATLRDVVRASIVAIDLILERGESLAAQKVVRSNVSGAPVAIRRKGFVSYSHKDRKMLAEFKTMLAPAIQKNLIDLWDDTQIRPGAKWREEIQDALARAKVAVLLVSPHFLASEFITTHELPVLLKAAQKHGVTVFWVCLSPCLYNQTEIASYQAAHDVGRPLDQLKKAERQATFKEICEKLLKELEQ